MHDERTTPQDESMTGILDVRDLSLDAVLTEDDSALTNAVRRIVAEMGRPEDSYAAHGSAAS